MLGKDGPLITGNDRTHCSAPEGQNVLLRTGSILQNVHRGCMWQRKIEGVWGCGNPFKGYEKM